MAAVFRCARSTLSVVSGVARVLQVPKTTHIAQLQRLQPFSFTSVSLADRKYSEKHEWVTLDGNIGTVGISEYAQDALGDIVYAQLPDVGAEFEAHDECGALESVKAASELYIPVSGTITEKNTAVEEKPGVINSAPYSDGWLFKVELSNLKELDDLLDESGYQEYLQSQEE